MKIAFIYEHPDWSNDLIEAFADNDIELKLVNVSDLAFDTAAGTADFSLAINRVNIMPSAGRAPQLAFHTLHYLNFLEQSGVRVVNGSRAHFAGASKAMQNGIFSRLGLDCPRAVGVYRVEDVMTAAQAIGFPIMLKPNLGGSGAGIARYNNESELGLAIRNKMIDFGVDQSGLVQQYVESDGFVYRVEVLGNQLFYGIRQRINEGTYNYCAAEGCSTIEQGDEMNFCAVDGRDRILPFEPDHQVVNDVVNIVRTAGADFGGVEYFLRENGSHPCYYDFNPYSNFVPDGTALFGFSPEQRFVDFILSLIR